MDPSRKSLIMDYFKKNPKREIHTSKVREEVKESFETHGKKLQDISTDVNQLHHEGRLIKVNLGVYKYDPNYDQQVELRDFTEAVKEVIFRRDGYKCVICGLGEQDGVTIDADHKIARSKGGSNTLANGQTLCRKHNTLKKNYSQTEAGKRYFKHLYKMALENQDNKMIAFCKEVFVVYDKHDVDRHIKL